MKHITSRTQHRARQARRKAHARKISRAWRRIKQCARRNPDALTQAFLLAEKRDGRIRL